MLYYVSTNAKRCNMSSLLLWSTAKGNEACLSHSTKWLWLKLQRAVIVDGELQEIRLHTSSFSSWGGTNSCHCAHLHTNYTLILLWQQASSALNVIFKIHHVNVMHPHLCTFCLDLIFGDDQFGYDAEHGCTLQYSRTFIAMLHNFYN